MLDENVVIIDIDPWQWRRMHSLLFPQGESKGTAYVLHRQGKVLRAFHSRDSGFLKVPEVVDDPLKLAAQIHAANEVDQVIILEQEAVKKYFGQIQKELDLELDYDQYALQMLKLLRDERYQNGIVIYPEQRATDRLEQFWELLEKIREGVLVVGVFEDHSIWTCWILGKRKGKIRLITTSDSLVAPGLVVREWRKDYKEILRLTEQRYGGPVAGLFMELPTFTRWVQATDKVDFLREAVKEGNVIADSLSSPLWPGVIQI